MLSQAILSNIHPSKQINSKGNHDMSNYPDNIRDFDNCAGSPFYEEAECCDKCDEELEYERDEDGMSEIHECKATYQCPMCESFNLKEDYFPAENCLDEIDAMRCDDCGTIAPLATWEKLATKAKDV